MVINSGPLAQGPKIVSPGAISQQALQASGQVTGFGQLRIAAEGGGTPCTVVPNGGHRRYQVEGALTGNPACRWTCGGGLAITNGVADQPVVEITGLFASGSVGDQHLTVVVNNTDTLTIPLTVASVTEITATIKATPPAGPALNITQQYNQQNNVQPIPDRPDQTFTSTRTFESFPPAFDKTTVLVLLRGAFPDLPLTARAEPGAAQVAWEAARAPGETLPQHQNPALPTLTSGAAGTARLAADATGSFAVRAYITCGCGNRHADLTTVLLVVMVQAELVQDRTTVSDAGLWNSSRISGPYRTDPYPGEAEILYDGTSMIDLDADFRLISGGPDGMRYIGDLSGAIRGYWCNNIVRHTGKADLSGTYTQGHTYQVLYGAKAGSASQPVLYPPNAVLTDIGGPIWDGTPPCEPPDSMRLAEATTVVSASSSPPGLLITARAQDSPNDFVPLWHPSGNTITLTRLTVDMRFMAAFYLCSQSALSVIGIACTIGWRVEADLTYQPPSGSNTRWSVQVATAPHVSKLATLPLKPVQSADLAQVMVWAPGSVNHIAKQYS